MGRFAIALMLAAALIAAAPAMAQGPLPDTLRSSTLTRVQEDELNRRLSLLQQRFGALAQETNLRETAVRNIAVEIYGADPNLAYETYVSLIENGARELRTYLTDARARTDPDPTAAAIRQRAIAAAEDGRLSEARALYDQVIAANRNARQRTRDAEDLADAADMAEAARLAYVGADYLDAARRYGEAAELAPDSARERWQYTVWRGDALWRRASAFVDPASGQQAIAAFEAALSMRSRETSPEDWASVQNSLGAALIREGLRGMPGALERAVGAFEAACAVYTREADPANWALAQMNLATALQILGSRGAPNALERAVAVYEVVLTVSTREADPATWARTQIQLGNALRRQGERGAQGALERALAAYEAALTVLTREAYPDFWAVAQLNLGIALELQGERGAPEAFGRAIVAFESALTRFTRETRPQTWGTAQMHLSNVLLRQGAPGTMERTFAGFEAALSVLTRDGDPVGWAETTYNLALAYRVSGQNAEARAAAVAALEVYERVGDVHSANQTRRLLAELPQ